MLKRTGSSNSLLGKCLNGGGLVAGGVDELVVDNLDIGVLVGEENDLVGDVHGLGESGNVLAGTGEAEDDVLGVGTTELGPDLLADEDELNVGVLGGAAADIAGQTGVNTTAETLVGAADDQELLLVRLKSLGLSRLENGVGGGAVDAGVLHGALSTVELGGGNDLHGVCDLLDVANRLQPALDLTECRIGCGIRGGRPVLDGSLGQPPFHCLPIMCPSSINQSKLCPPPCPAASPSGMWFAIEMGGRDIPGGHGSQRRPCSSGQHLVGGVWC